MEQWEKCDICKWKDKDENCIKILGCMGSRTPCIYIKKCEIFASKNPHVNKEC